MIKAFIFDCFNVLYIPAGRDKGYVRNQPLLERIAELRPRFKTALLSNMSASGLAELFSPPELDKLFDEVIISSQVGLVKPSPDIFLLAAARLGCEPRDCLFIDDKQVHCDGARAAGLQAWQYTGTHEAVQQIRHCIKKES